MRSARAILGMILAVLFVPLTSHCELEAVPGFEFLQCPPDLEDADTQADHPCDAECCLVEFSKYQIQRSEVMVSETGTSPEPFFLCPATGTTLPLLAVNAGVPVYAPPEPPARPWQFFLRAACPPRAPDLPI